MYKNALYVCVMHHGCELLVDRKTCTWYFLSKQQVVTTSTLLLLLLPGCSMNEEISTINYKTSLMEECQAQLCSYLLDHFHPFVHLFKTSAHQRPRLG